MTRIAAHGLAKRFGERRVFSGVDVDLPDDGFLLVTGPNGSGKTTLLPHPCPAWRSRPPGRSICRCASRSATSGTTRSSTAS